MKIVQIDKHALIVAVGALALTVAPAAWAGGAHCNEQHTQASYNEMAQKLATKGYLGLSTEKNAAGTYQVKGIEAGSPAAAAGFQVGDVLVALNGVALNDAQKEALMKVKSTLGPGKTATYTIQRAGAERKVAATLSEVPREVLARWVGEHVIEHSPTVRASN